MAVDLALGQPHRVHACVMSAHRWHPSHDRREHQMPCRCHWQAEQVAVAASVGERARLVACAAHLCLKFAAVQVAAPRPLQQRLSTHNHNNSTVRSVGRVVVNEHITKSNKRSISPCSVMPGRWRSRLEAMRRGPGNSGTSVLPRRTGSLRRYSDGTYGDSNSTAAFCANSAQRGTCTQREHQAAEAASWKTHRERTGANGSGLSGGGRRAAPVPAPILIDGGCPR